MLFNIRRRPNKLTLEQNQGTRSGWQALKTRSIWCLTVNPWLGFRNKEA